MDEMSEGLSHAATLKQRFKEAWRLLEAGDSDAAEAMAVELLLEARLSRYHTAGCHIILSTSSDNSFEHGIKTLRRYNDILARTDLTEVEGYGIFAGFNDAMKLIDKARQEKASSDQQIQEKQRLDTGEAGISEGVPETQAVPELAGESQHTSHPTISQRTDNTDATVDTVLGMDLDFDDNEPLPDIVKYKPSSGVKKDEDQV